MNVRNIKIVQGLRGMKLTFGTGQDPQRVVELQMMILSEPFVSATEGYLQQFVPQHKNKQTTQNSFIH